MTEKTVYIKDSCPLDGNKLVNSRFDAAFRDLDGEEQLIFAVPAGLCTDCNQLYLDPEIRETILVDENSRCFFAIETDQANKEREDAKESPSS